MSRPLLATIWVSALEHNLRVVRQCAPQARVWAVVKADAYGHGLAAIWPGLAQADGLALLEWSAACQLRAWGWQRPILMLEGAFSAAQLTCAAQHDLSLVVHDAQQVHDLAQHRGPSLHVWLKVNTGMNRLGFAPHQAAGTYAALRGLPGVASVAWLTHFANADQVGGTRAPRAQFAAVVAGLEGAHSWANSAALLGQEGAPGDWVRPGIMLYGATPFADRSAASLGLQPAMQLQSALIAVQRLAEGDAVGYGGNFVASGPMRIGIVACGYADGYPRHAPTGTPVAVAGVRTRTVGRVSMDMLAVDLGPVPQAAVGAPVELWGGQIPVDEVAQAAGTIGYELLCAVAPRVARHVHGLSK